MSNKVNGWSLIGCKDGAYYFCDSVFDHGDGHVGATGSIVRPVSAKEWEWATDRENVAEYLCGCYEGDTDSQDFEDWVDSVIQHDGVDSIMFDESDCCDASDSFDDLDIEHECTDCIGCGRIFGRTNEMDFDEVYNRKALVAIMALEDGAVSKDYAAKIVF